MRCKFLGGLLIGLVCGFSARGDSWLAVSADQLNDRADAVFRGTVVSVESRMNALEGHIHTRTVVQVEEVFKGTMPLQLTLDHRGGVAGGRGESDGGVPLFRLGEEWLLWVSRRADGTVGTSLGNASAQRLGPAVGQTGAGLTAVYARLLDLRSRTWIGPLPGKDLSDVAPRETGVVRNDLKDPPSLSPVSNATNLLTGSDLIPARFTVPDRGEGIPYYIDAQYLPAGLSLTQAVGAVQAALAAWTNVTSVRYRFAGFQYFGQAAADVAIDDGALRIQLHDNYHYLAGAGGSDLLGKGGSAYIVANLSPGWATGGNVSGNDFHRILRGYVVLQHTNTAMQTLSTFTEVLAHEIGHTIGLAHSSENALESDPLLKQAVMYFLVHADGRGAALNGYDIGSSRQVHPPFNTPPYNYDRVMDIVTSPSPISAPGVNLVQVRGYDLQTTNLSFQTADPSSNNGSFTVTASNISYAASLPFSDSGRFDPAGSLCYDVVYGRYSDGTNAAAYATIRVISFYLDSYSEGVPNSWRATYFGSANPNSGPNRHAGDDFDGDRYSNLLEWQLGSNPTNSNSNLRMTLLSGTNLQWEAKPYEVYDLYASTDLTNWARASNPIVPTAAPALITGFTNGGPRQFFRVQKLP